MAKKVFHFLDEATFKGVDNLKSQPQFSQASTAMEGLPDEYQKWINQGLTYIISFFPILIFLIVLVFAALQRGETESREELIQEISKFNSLNSQINTLGNSLLGRTSLKDEAALRDVLKSFENDYNIKPGSLKVISFEPKSYGSLVEAKADIVFQGLSTPKVVALLEMLSVRENSKIYNLSLKKGKDVVKGEISFIHFSKIEQAAP